MLVEIKDLRGVALDYAIAKILSVKGLVRNFPGYAYIPKGKRAHYKWSPTENPKQSLPLIEQFIDTAIKRDGVWYAEGRLKERSFTYGFKGETMIEACLRVILAAHIDTHQFDVPAELVELAKVK